jgi:nucleoside-diphosphate-sugar epimerase
MTVLVTGAAGFLGSHLVELLLEEGEAPRVYRGDVADPAALASAMRGVDRVLHCAARTGPWGPADEYERVNVHGLETLVRTALAAGVRRIVHVSSITVHGNDVRGAADETTPLREEPNPYSRSKVAGERLLERMIREQAAPVTIVRPGWIYGPGDRASFARLAEKVGTGRMMVVGDGSNRLPLIYVRDVARGILLAAEARQANGRSYLLVNDEPVTQRDFLDAIADEMGVPAPKRRLPYRLALTVGTTAEAVGRLARMRNPPPVMRYGLQLLGGENRFDITRAREELGFDPLVDLAEGVRRTVAWYRAADELSQATAVAA